MPDRVLLVGDEYYASLAAVRALRRGGYEPWLATWKARTYAARSRATAGTVLVPSPDLGLDTLAVAVAEKARKLRVSAVLAGTERTLLALAGRDDSFAGIALGAPSPEAVACAIDKSLLPELAAESGLETPPTVVFEPGELAAIRDRLRFPAVVKPVRSTGDTAEGALDVPRKLDRRLESFAEAEEALAAVPRCQWIAQPYLEGELEAVSGVAWNGEVVCSLRQRARRLYPLDCGVSAYAETVEPDPALDEGLRRLIGVVGWSGIFEAQFVRSEGTPYLIDLNPRLYGSLALAVRAGLNLPAIWTDLLLGRRPSPNGYAVGVRYRAEHRDLLTLATLARQGRVREALAGALPRPRTTHAIFSLRDPAPVMGLFASLGRRIREG